MLGLNLDKENQSNCSYRHYGEHLPLIFQDMADIIYERCRRKKFSLFNLINPWWMMSSLACALFRFLGYRKSKSLPHTLEYLSNPLRDDDMLVKYPLRYSMQSIIPTLEDSVPHLDSKCTQTELENYFHDRINSQIEQLVKVRRFRNAVKPCRKRVRKIMSRHSNDFLKALNSKNRDRFGGSVTKFRRNRTVRSTGSLRRIRSDTSMVDVDNAMEDVFYITDSDD